MELMQYLEILNVYIRREANIYYVSFHFKKLSKITK